MRKKYVIIYTLIGVLFGLCFPIGAYFFEFIRNKLSVSLKSLFYIHRINPLLFMIDSAPLFLGIFAMIGGVSRQKSENSKMKLSETVTKLDDKQNELSDALEENKIKN